MHSNVRQNDTGVRSQHAESDVDKVVVSLPIEHSVSFYYRGHYTVSLFITLLQSFGTRRLGTRRLKLIRLPFFLPLSQSIWYIWEAKESEAEPENVRWKHTE